MIVRFLGNLEVMECQKVIKLCSIIRGGVSSCCWLGAEPTRGANLIHWYDDVNPDLLHFKSSQLLFSKEFLVEYLALCSQSPLAMMSIKDTLMIREPMLQDVKQGKFDKVILRQKELEKEVSDLTDELVPVVSVSFKRAKEEVIFLYPPLDLSLLDPFKVVKGGVMVDEEVTTPHEPEPFPSLAEGVVREGGDPESLHLEPTIEEEIL
ncbi:unnamed protein product [Vicia faba]|uniref:Uncharacterized protein n=1 Tax=Vicia faba TaxID=3906 RepID=A0AAV0YYV0_VICFA|nr:unnamed protein product [Vicia faba]